MKTTLNISEPVKLPPSGYEAVFQLSMNGKNLTIVVPDVDKEDKNSYEAYMDVAGGEQKYSVIVKHPYDKVVRNFTVTGAEVERPGKYIQNEERKITNFPYKYSLYMGML